MGGSDESIPKYHVCPPSNATHPRDRWETVFAYSFINKFTDLRKKVEDFNSAMECAHCDCMNALNTMV